MFKEIELLAIVLDFNFYLNGLIKVFYQSMFRYYLRKFYVQLHDLCIRWYAWLNVKNVDISCYILSEPVPLYPILHQGRILTFSVRGVGGLARGVGNFSPITL